MLIKDRILITVEQVSNRDMSHHKVKKTIICRLWIVDTSSTIQII